MSFYQVKEITKYELLKEFEENKTLASFIVGILEKRVYLPNDFIISKNDIGDEMYFLAEGTAYVLSPNEKRVLGILQPWAYFGEFALYKRTLRISPIIASSFCIVYVLKRKAFQELLKNFPGLYSDYIQICEEEMEER